VLAYALPRAALDPLLPPALVLDALGEHGFAAIALVQAERLRPAFAPAALGIDAFLVGYRIFVRVAANESLRGLHVLRTDADSAPLALVSNVVTRYRVHRAHVSLAERGGRLDVSVRTDRGEADLDLSADLASRPAPLPPDSPFADEHEARRFAGPLPYTFDHEPETGALVAVRGMRAGWEPETVAVDVRRAAFLDRFGVDCVLANAFYVGGVDYRWERGRVLRTAT
jgi:hypothetical protein